MSQCVFRGCQTIRDGEQPHMDHDDIPPLAVVDKTIVFMDDIIHRDHATGHVYRSCNTHHNLIPCNLNNHHSYWSEHVEPARRAQQETNMGQIWKRRLKNDTHSPVDLWQANTQIIYFLISSYHFPKIISSHLQAWALYFTAGPSPIFHDHMLPNKNKRDMKFVKEKYKTHKMYNRIKQQKTPYSTLSFPFLLPDFFWQRWSSVPTPLRTDYLRLHVQVEINRLHLKHLLLVVCSPKVQQVHLAASSEPILITVGALLASNTTFCIPFPLEDK